MPAYMIMVNFDDDGKNDDYNLVKVMKVWLSSAIFLGVKYVQS